MNILQPSSEPRRSIHPTPDYDFTDLDGDTIRIGTVPGGIYRDGREGHVTVMVADQYGTFASVHVPASEAHVLAAAILAHAFPETTAYALDLDDYRISHGDAE